MKIKNCAWLIVVPLAILAGCGGSNSGPIVTPTATPIVTGTPIVTPTATAPVSALTGRIVFSDGAAISVVNADGSNRRVLTNGLQPVLSPDGSRVAFIANGALQVIPTSGGAASRLVNDTSAISPAWSFDGTKLAYSSQKSSPTFTSRFSYGIWVVDSSGANARQLTVGQVEQIWSEPLSATNS